ncbi:flagellar M-ring protein FliF C-terminal domain-containing protein [Actinoplanes subglobosus]|uniref:Flagellar M-ring protein FliF C-terminal domain-containing protein n=1 Tax=Actinoplanes subglobosus TaxID=1547892 RepID=A0ABV8IPA7_9ACTN
MSSVLAVVALAVGGVSGPARAVPRLETAAAAYQDRLDSSLQKMVDAVVGPGRAVVTTNAELDLDQVETVSTTYSRDPSVGALAERLSSRVSAGGGNTFQSTGVDRTNALNSIRETRRTAPGAVKRLTIAVAVDAAASTNIDLTQLRKLVSVAAGTDAARGDTVVVSAMPFHTAEATDVAAAAPDRRGLWLGVASGVLVLLLLLAGWRRRARQVRDAAARERLLEARAALEAQRPLVADAVTVTRASTERPVVERQRAVGQLVAASPDQAAAVLRGWTGSAG